jgi:hypothetical protein
MPINFPFRDLTNQYISLSYQDVTQRYTQGTASYILDGLGNVIGFIPVGSLGQQIMTADQPASVSASYALTASVALNAASSPSASWASHSYSSDIATAALTSTFADTASLALESMFADTASLASYSTYAGSASYSISSSHAVIADTASFIDPSLVPVAFFPLEFKFSTSTLFSNPGIGKFKFDNAIPANVATIYINDTTNGGLDISKLITRLQSGSHDLYVQEKDDASISLLYSVAGSPVDEGGWFSVPVVYESAASGVPANNSVCLLAVLSSPNQTSSHAQTADTASFAFNAVSASYAPFMDDPNALSASWASSSITADTASYLKGFNFVNTGSLVSFTNNDIPIIQMITGSYDAAFFDYVALSGSNTRAGMVFGSWVNGSINYTEVSNVDIGDTSKVTMSLALAGNVVQLIANVTDTLPWKIKALARYL